MNTNGQSKFRNAYVSKEGGNEQFDVHDGYGTTARYMADIPKAFYVRVHVNNDGFSPGKKMVISNKTRTFDKFLDDCTERCKPYFGHAERLHTPIHGRRIHDLNELRSDQIYVITGQEGFKKKNYQDIQPPKPNWKKGQFKKIDVDRIYTPVSHQHDPRLRNLEGRAREMGRRCTAVRLKIHMNGDYTSESIPITIKDAKSKSLVEIMNIIQDTLHSQQLSRLYKVVNDGGSLQNFHQLTENDIPQLENGDHIVALEKTPYKLAPKTYHKRNNFDTSASPRHNRSLTPPRRKQFSKHKPLPSIGSSNQSQNDTMSPFSNAPSHGGRKSNKSKGSRNQRDYDTDEGGVFKAKKQNNAQGAHQERVNEDADMHRIDEFADESFNHYEQNTSGPITGDPRSSTPASQGEARKKREQEEYQAAAKIQAGARAYKARKEYKAKKEAKRQDDDDRRRRQQEEEADRFEEEARRKAEDNSKQKQLDEDKAATKIQASFKGHKARKDFKERQAAKQQGQQ